MNKKFVAIITVALSLILGLSLTPAFAQNSNNKSGSGQDLPERNGVYNVPGHPELKVRVFVHNPHPGRPNPTPTPPPICGAPDPDSVSTVPAADWHLPAGTWTYYLNLNSAPSSIGSNLVTIATDAFGEWSGTNVGSSGGVSFSYGGATTASRQALDGKNIISWGRTSGTALAITYTWYYPTTGEAAETDTIFNKKFPWSWTPYAADACVNPSTYDAQNILTHELGHWMGLNDIYDAENYQNATMYGYGSTGEIKKDTLTTGDSAGVAAIY